MKKEGILLKKTKLTFEDEGVLNPAAIREGDNVHMFYRAVSMGNHSSIGYCKFKGPLELIERSGSPILVPEAAYESQGVEDPRIVKIDDLYYLSYTAYDGLNALGALATSTDLVKWDRRGLVVPCIHTDEFKRLAQTTGTVNKKYYRENRKSQKNLFLWDKNVIFFPRRINGKLHFLHRIKPGIQLVAIDELSDLTPEFWTDYFLHFHDHILLEPRLQHESSYLGGGCPPIETSRGWLLIYHGVCDTPQGFVYSACAALMDLNDPLKELARLPYALFGPEFKWELYGVVDYVVFPTGAALFDDRLYIYYGAADKRIACASVNINELLDELERNIPG